MATRRKCGGFGVGLVRSTSFGRKRVTLSNFMEIDSSDPNPPKRHCNENNPFPSPGMKSPLEALPQDILIRILCGVEHDDLKRLYHVSKSIKEAALIAKRWHFAYSTPTKTVGFRDPVVGSDDSGEVEPPDAPKQSRVPRKRLGRKELAGIAVSLFASSSADGWPRRESFM